MSTRRLMSCSWLLLSGLLALPIVAAPGAGDPGSPVKPPPIPVPPDPKETPADLVRRQREAVEFARTRTELDRSLAKDVDRQGQELLRGLRSTVLSEMTLRDAPLRDIMDFLKRNYTSATKEHDKQGNTLNIVLDHSVEGYDLKVTLDVRNVSYYEALDLCCRVAGLEFVVEKNAVVIRRPAEKTASGAYLVETRITPTEGTNTYLAEFRIRRGNKDGSATDISKPKMTVVLGSEGRMEIADEEGKNGLFCTVLVKEEEKGGISASTHVTVREGGKVVSDTAQSISMPARRVNAAVDQSVR